MVDWLFGLLTDAPQAYLILFAVAAGDAIVPALPSESAVILAGVLSAGDSELALGWVVAAAAAGAFVGDNTSYAIGRLGGRPFRRWLLRRRRGRSVVDWAASQLERRGGTVIVVARFVPGGRTAATVTAGLTRYPHRRFAAFAALAAAAWAVYAAMLGHLGGRVFHERTWLALIVAFALAAGLALAAEEMRHAASSRRRRRVRGTAGLPG